MEKGALTQGTAHTLTLDTNRGHQVGSKRDVAKVGKQKVRVAAPVSKEETAVL